MEFNVTLTEKTSRGDTTTLKFEPTEEAKTVCDCDAIIVKVPIDSKGYFVGNQYKVSISDFIVEEVITE